jgi:long-chain acyl-CoA synthetase
VALPEDAGSRTAGHPLPGTEVRISGDGEILVSGPGLADGYHGRRVVPLDQAERGWLRTGDAGVLDAEGRLRVLGRYVARVAD